jgi:hypothetical protein
MVFGLFSEDSRKHRFLTGFEHNLCQPAFMLLFMRNMESAVFWKIKTGFASGNCGNRGNSVLPLRKFSPVGAYFTLTPKKAPHLEAPW